MENEPSICVFKLGELKEEKYNKQCIYCGFAFWEKGEHLSIFRHCTVSNVSRQPNKPLNFIKALTKFIALSVWKRELQYVNGEQYKTRLEICDACNYRHPEKPECMVCSCKLKAVFNKAQLKTEKCPLGKWPILYDPIQVSK